MAAKFDNLAFEKKLKDLDSSQTSIQTLSLWIMHHGKYAKYIVNSWLKYIKKVPVDRRLVLFYLANDVIQNSRKKNKELVSAFGKVVKASLPLLNHVKIKPPVERVLKIWEERKIYNQRYIEDLRLTIADGTSFPPKAAVKAKETEPEIQAKPIQETKKTIPKDFKLSRVLNHMKKMKSIDEDLSLKSRKLSMLKVDASDIEAVKQVKDRCGVDRFVQEFEESKLNLDEYCKILNRSISEKKSLIEELDGADAYFDSAYGEAKTIVKAYKTFGSRLSAIKKKLDLKIEKIKAQELAAREQEEKETAEKEAAAAELAQKEAEKKAQDELNATTDKIVVEDMDLESDSSDESNTEEIEESLVDGTKSEGVDDKATTNESNLFGFDDAPSPVSTSSDDSIASPIGTPEGLNLESDSVSSSFTIADANSTVEAPSVALPPNFPTMPGIPFQLPPTQTTAATSPGNNCNESSSRASTPVQDEDDSGHVLPTSVPAVTEKDNLERHEAHDGKVGSILDSLFPMLSKSLQTIRQQEASRFSPGNQLTPDDNQDIVGPDSHHLDGRSFPSRYGLNSQYPVGKRQHLNSDHSEIDVDNHVQLIQHQDSLGHGSSTLHDCVQRRSRSPPYAVKVDLKQRRESVEHLKRVHDSITNAQYPATIATLHAGVGMKTNARTSAFYSNRRSPTPELDGHINSERRERPRSATPELDNNRLNLSHGDVTPPLGDNDSSLGVNGNGRLIRHYLRGPPQLRPDADHDLHRRHGDFEQRPVDGFEHGFDENGLSRGPHLAAHALPFNQFRTRDTFPDAMEPRIHRHTNFPPQHFQDDNFHPQQRYIRHPRGPMF